MATYYVSPSGNDSNTGTLASPWLTVSRAYATATFSPLLANGDTLIFRNGNFTLTAAVSTLINHNKLAYPAETPTMLGAFDLTMGSTSGNTYIYGITYGAGNGSNAKLLFGTAQTFLENCNFSETTQNTTKAALRGNNFKVICKNCNFTIGTNNSTPPLLSNTSTGNTQAYFQGCNFDKYTSFYNGSAGQVQLSVQSSTFKNFTDIYGTSATGSATAVIFSDFQNNTFYNCTNLYNFSGASNLDNEKHRYYKNYFGFTKLINNSSTGAFTCSSLLNDSNVGLSATVTTGFTQTNYTTVANTAAAKFYSTTSGSEDFRIEIDSPLVLSTTSFVGAFSPEWDAFWSDLATSDVGIGVPYRVRSRTNNRTGILTGGAGETDVNKVLTTSLLVSGTINPNTVLNTNVNGTLPQSAVKASNGGTLPLNKVAPSQGGTYDGNESNDSLVAGDLKIGVSKNNLGSTVVGTYTGADRNTSPLESKVAAGVTWKSNSLTDNKTGTRTDADPSKVLYTEPTYGGDGTEFTPTYVPSGGSSIETFNKTLLKSILGTGVNKI